MARDVFGRCHLDSKSRKKALTSCVGFFLSFIGNGFVIKLLVIDSTGAHAHRYQLRQSKKPENVDTLIVGSSVCLCSFVSWFLVRVFMVLRLLSCLGGMEDRSQKLL